MENREIMLIHELNKQIGVLVSDLNVIVNTLSELSKAVYDREIEKCSNEIDIKLKSHM